MKRWVAVAALSLLGCGASAGNSATGAAVMASLAAASSVASRSAGGCYAQCTHGTVCNTRTGLCERQPCGGQCIDGQVCDPVTDTCAPAPKSVPVQVIGMLASGMWWWPFSPYFGYLNPYQPGPWQDPYYNLRGTPARPPSAVPGGAAQDGLPPGL